MMTFSAVKLQAKGMQPRYLETVVTFDINSAPIDVDNRCTGFISNQIKNFKGPMVKSDRNIEVFGVSRTTVMTLGTLSCK